MSHSAFRAFVNWQVRLSNGFDSLLPERYRIVGRRHFREVMLPAYIKPNQVVYDVGGGSLPCLTLQQKNDLHVHLVGLDIDGQELTKAPSGVYDMIVESDITSYVGKEESDLVVCQATMEHVHDTEKAFRSFATILKPGGRLLIVVPSRNAIFARINLVLPEHIKRRLLFAIFPHKGLGHDGFPAFYDRCTPNDFRAMAHKHGFIVELLVPHYYSSYFTFFFPLFVLWRIWVIGFEFFCGEQAAEVFSMVCRKR